MLIFTDTYRPPVGATTANDVPFVVESSEEFPAAHGYLNCIACAEKEKTHMKILYAVYESITEVPVKNTRPAASLGFSSPEPG